MLHDTNNAAQEIREAFDRVLPQYGVTVVAEERFTSQERDFRTLLAKLKAYAPQPDILYIGGFSPQLEIIGRQFAQMGHWSETRAYKDTVKHGRVAVSTRIKPPLTTCECFDETQEKQVFEGCWYVAPAMPDEEALQQYKKRFGMQMIGSVALAYNVVMLTAQAYETAPSEEIPPSHATVAQILRETKEFKGLASTVTNDGRGFFVAPAVTKVIRDGKAVVEK
jgi:ABC-type branched-subunit amino acid transport system substrate-binding protein